MNKIKEFFWICSGSHLRTVTESDSEHSKYAGIGATIFFTGLFAALAGAYALYTVFDNWIIAGILGLVWGLMIFNLDRYIVSSMKKRKNKSSELYMALPRVILALIISLVIAKPLELKIFDKEINNELELMKQEDIQAKMMAVDQYYDPKIAATFSEISQLKREILEKETVRDTLRIIAQKEADGTGGTMQRNAGPIYRIKKADADRADAELKELRTLNGALINEREASIAVLEMDKKKDMEVLVASQYGLAGRLAALDRITDKQIAVAVAHWFIVLLFIAVETAPILVKLISDRGPYDHRISTIEYESQAIMLADVATINERMKKKAEKLRNSEKEFVNRELDTAIQQI